MRPNTKFAYTWKVVFVFCILIEIVNLAYSPILATNKSKGSKSLASFSAVVENLLIPTPVLDLPACSCYTKEREQFNSFILALVGPSSCPKDPFFCRPPFSTAQYHYIQVVRFIAEHIMVLVGFIVFLDVPIYFFTGELCQESGLLVPKPIFQRWIAPGLLVQLLANPQMENFSIALCNLVVASIDIGPVKVIRWIQALFFPLLVGVFDFLESRVWVPFVAYINQSKGGEVAVTEDGPADLHRIPSLTRASTMRHSSIARKRSSTICTPRISSCVRPRRATMMSLGQPPRSSFGASGSNKKKYL